MQYEWNTTKPASFGAPLSVHLSDYMTQQPTGLIKQSAYDKQRIGGVFTVIVAYEMTIVLSCSHGQSEIVPMTNFERYGSSEASTIVATILVVRC